MTTVVLSRPQHRIPAAQHDYQQAGYKTLSMPCFAVQTNTEVTPEQLAQAERAPLLLIFNSNAIKHLLLLKPDFTLSQNTTVMGVGEGVADYWQAHFDQPILTPASQDSAGMMALLDHHRPENLVILTAAGGLDLVRRYCIDKQIHYQQINTYQRVPLSLDFEPLKQSLDEKKSVVLTATSGLILQHFWQQCPDNLKTKICELPLISGAERISNIAKDLGFHKVVIADSPSNQDMIAALISVETRQL
ncbi:uroporphyrinogen-III synthase [Marinicella gelatinilytica]|uniref:uroporphyrinogen-III synthase n=1 Tax=Marinicella gelatinilytica TaxID=2996017 RepID=UPI002260C8F8|nr:uroporphyrinogen-III synthase [Marinicella gelatinilytica]MCX7544931.1 uroporphyrinogen-III synthase [Marinicella gelatinilytica]